MAIMRFTLEHSGDVEVPEGSTVGSCRSGLVALTGIDALATAPLVVDGYLLEEGQLAGAEPWVPGCVMRVGGQRGVPSPVPAPDPARAALVAPWHVAVLAGPDAGRVALPGDEGCVQVGRRRPGRGGHERGPAGMLALGDPAVSAEHARIRRLGRGWVVRDLGSANGTRVEGLRARRGRRPVTRRVGSRRGRRVVPGQEVRLGSTVLVVRLVEAAPAESTAGGTADVRAEAPPRVPAATWLVPALVSIALALALRSMVPLLFAVTAVVPALGGLRRGPRAAPPRALGRWPDLAACAVRAAAGSGERVALGAAGRRPPPTADPSEEWWSAIRAGIAVTGEREAALGVARALVAAAIAEPDMALVLALGPVAAQDWSWCRWIEHRTSRPGGRRLLVADGADRSGLDRWSVSRGDGDGVLLVMGEPREVPAWCGWTVDGSGRCRRRGAGPEPDQGRLDLVPAAGAAWAEEQGRRIAARDHRLRRATALLPDRIGLVGLGAPTDPQSVAALWSRQAGPMASLIARISVDLTGPAELDLLADGPHVLIAGTTGAGKSALLQSLVLDLALRHPPDRLAVVLIDFKGGAGLGPCRRLPHVVGEVTDLDAALAARAVDGLRRELGRRERLLREAGVTDLEALRSLGPAPPRILVVVDELRALRDDLPGVLPALVRLAAQGRSLGIHLVLATQRPAGAVDAQVRANVSLRICLRVTDPADSLDVVEVPDAAGLPADRPGRAVIRRGPGAPVVEQTAWAAIGSTATAARWAPPWPGVVPGGATGPAGEPGARTTGPTTGRVPGGDVLPGLVDAACRAAQGRTGPAALWAPPLPTSVADADLPQGTERTGALAFGLADHAELVDAVPARWDPADGALLVVGRPGSGRTTALDAVTRSALRAGLTVHRIAGRPLPSGVATGTRMATGQAPGALGTTVDVTDPRRIHRLLDLLRAGGGQGAVEHLLVVDDVGGVLRALEQGRAGQGPEAFGELLRDAARLGIGIAAAGGPAEVLRLLPHAANRLVLATGDPHEDAVLGVPREAGRRSHPGRGVLLPEARSVQVCSGPGAGHAAQDGGPIPRRGRPRLEPIPLDVVLSEVELATADLGPRGEVNGAGRRPRGEGDRASRLPRGEGGRAGPGPEDSPMVVLGRGGDDAGLVRVPLRAGLLVIGPPRSGRSTALATIRAALTAGEPGSEPDDSSAKGPDSRPLAVPHLGTPGGPRREVLELSELVASARSGGRSGAGAGPGNELAALLRGWWASCGEAADEPVLLVDDLERVLRSWPGVDELLSGWIERRECGERVPLVVAAVSTEAAAAGYRGAVAVLRRSAPVLVLAPSTPGSTEAAGRSVLGAADPAFPRHPGRGVLLLEEEAVPLQVGRLARRSPAEP